jgi:SanA protein
MSTLSSVEHAPRRDVALVLGAHPGPRLRARAATAAALWHAGLCTRLLLSGLPREVHALIDVVTELRVPREALLLDTGATRTVENLRRARDVFAVRDPLVVTQAWHLPRALRLARALGLDAHGVVVPDVAPALSTRLREHSANVRAWLEIAIGAI